MRNKYLIAYSTLFVIFASAGFAPAQTIRSHVNKGVKLYKDGRYVDSEVEFKKGLAQAPANFQAHYNLGDSYYKEGKYDEAMKSYNTALPKAGGENRKSDIFYNMGNSLLKDKKIKESIGAYVDALKLNPNDQDAKYNLSYAIDLLKNQNQNKDKNKNNQDKNDQKQNKQDNNQKNKDQNKQQQNQQAQMKQSKISRDQAEAILSALNNDEKALQKRLRKMKAEQAKTDKDW
ncbi:MAG TPA: tetratricopeptide repeat protein [Candidatus Kryptonia bacterium]